MKEKSPANPRMLLRLYSKRRCPLCEVAQGILAELSARHPGAFEVDVRYIEDSPSDFERFRYDVPVLFVDQERAFEHRFTLEEVEKRVLHDGIRVAQSRPRDA